MAQRESQSIPVPMMLLSDVFGLVFSVFPVTMTYLLMIHFAYHLWENKLAFIGLILFSPYIACLVLIGILFLLRMIIPKMRHGVFRIGATKGFLAWYLNFFMNRAITLSGLKKFMFTNLILRFLYLRAMGAKISFQITGSMGIDFTDLPLIEVGKGTTLSEGVTLSAHTFTGESLLLSQVKIGENVFMGMDVVAGPGTHIGNGSWIGARNTFISEKIPAGSFFPNSAWPNGNPSKNQKSEIRLGPLPETKSTATKAE